MSTPITENDADYFRTVSWCAELLDNPRFVLQRPTTRVPKASSEDSFIAETLKTDRTIRHWVSLYSAPDKHLSPPIREAFTLLDLGNGVNGYPNICHGGFVATMLDEVMGVLLNANHDLAEEEGRYGGGSMAQMTAYLNVGFKRPVRTPGIVLATAKISKAEDRKWWIEGTIEDRERRLLATAEGLFVRAKSDPRL